MENLKQSRYRVATFLRKVANRIAPKAVVGSVTYPDIGADRLPKNAFRALIIYGATGIQRLVEGRDNDPVFKRHTIHWETTEMVRLLNHYGYIVDYADHRSLFTGDWQKYALVIDHWNNLCNAPKIPGQKKVNFTTYNHWLEWNTAELKRIRMFYERTGIIVPMCRQIPVLSSDEYADYLTYFGTDLQKDSFSKKPEKIQLNISSAWVPEYNKKDFAKARNKFLWIGGGGLVHKGLDIVLEAFNNLPETELYIVCNLHDPNEKQFMKWAAPLLAQHPKNWHYHGWMDLTSREFDAIADQCAGIVYASGAEGGPGSIARAIHNGLIPIVTPSSFVRAEIFGYLIEGYTDREMINSTIKNVQQLMWLPEHELRERSDAVRDFAGKYHTRQAFSESFSNLIQLASKSHR